MTLSDTTGSSQSTTSTTVIRIALLGCGAVGGGVLSIPIDGPAAHTASLPLSRDARILAALEDPRIVVGGIVPNWGDVAYAVQAQDDTSPAELHATTLS